jgi:Bacterial Ig-like domain (group 3)
MRFTTKLGAALTSAAIAAALGLAALGQPGAAAAQDLPGGTWGPALAVNLTVLPPAGTHFAGGSIQAVSCASSGNCAAIGTYGYTTTAGVDTPYPFVLSETGGTWGTPAVVPGITSSTPDQSMNTATVSCAGPGECAASWTYEDANGDGHAYLIDESRGAWGQAQPVTIGTAGTWLSGVSCPAAGDCTAAGHYRDGGAGSGLPFVMDSSAGTWGAPREVSGVAGLSTPSPVYADLTSVSCTSAGNCVAGGSYNLSSTDGQLHMQPFLATETGGSWGQAQPVAGVTTLDPGGWANLRSVSCADSGDCTAIGFYFRPGAGDHTWVARESGGNWGPAQQLPAPTASGRTLGESLSCSPQGFCAVAGFYLPPSPGRYKAFVATYTSGAWTAQDVPGVVATQSGATTVSCGAPGYCTVAGFYYPPGSGWYQPFIANDVNGTWASAQDVAGTPAGLAEIDGLSCTTPGYCTAFGMSHGTTFTVSEATAATITLQASAPTVTYGDEEAETLTATVTSPAGGTPTGTVTITDGKLAACQITLMNGTGSCTLPATALPGGTGQLTATYTGDASYAAASSTATVTVAKATTTPVMTVSPPR